MIRLWTTYKQENPRLWAGEIPPQPPIEKEKKMNAQKTTYKQVSKSAEKNILSVCKNVCTFAAFKHTKRHESADKSSQPFLCLILTFMQSIRVVVCGSSNARKDKLRSPEQHHNPLLFNVQKYEAMNTNTKTAGETAREQLTVGSYEERKNAMVQLLKNSGTAFMVYLDENCNIRTCGIAEDGYESMLLPMLDIATNKARRVAEEALL